GAPGAKDARTGSSASTPRLSHDLRDAAPGGVAGEQEASPPPVEARGPERALEAAQTQAFRPLDERDRAAPIAAQGPRVGHGLNPRHGCAWASLEVAERGR